MVIYLYRILVFIILALLTSCIEDPVKTSIDDNYISSIAKSDSYLFASASNGQIFRSSDGEGWYSLVINNSILLLDIESTPNGRIIASGENGVILISTNNGENWSKKATGVSSFLKDVLIYNDSTYYAGGRSGTLIKTTDFGETWELISTPFSTQISKLSLINNEIYIGLRTSIKNSPLLYKYEINTDTIISIDIEFSSFITDITEINGEVYLTDYSGCYKLIENAGYSKELVHSTNNGFIAQKILSYNNEIALVGYSGFNLGKIITGIPSNPQVKEFEESIYFNSGIVFSNKLIAGGGDEFELAVLQNSNWKIIKLK
ncbi:MAG: hypothetical protein CVV25_12730 [Ignavibacteriae bacterium HGW-Ignavibacteriae-4]|jgi:hypothetical protein|nr:MAG: hypothetical protein CVV25_12730 [Ignavibacteriae bacterium HGW-Ignavibacteriae-4]